MTRIVRTLFACSLLFAGPAASAATTELLLASDVWPPFTDVPGRPRVAIELVQEALARAGIEARFDIVEFERVIQGIGLGNYDGSAALWKDPDREKYLDFSAPYLENRLVLVGRKGADVSAADLGQLAERKVAVVAGYSYGEAVGDAAGPVFVEGASDQENLTWLLAGEVDYMLVDELVIRYVVRDQRTEAEARLAIGTIPLVVRPLHFALARGVPGAGDIIARFDEAIAGMIADGTFNRILGLNWIRADVDGDGRLELVGTGDGVGSEGPEASYALAAGDEGGEGDRFWIEGRLYESWTDVPEKYKYRTPKDEAVADPGATLYRLEF